MEEFRHRRLPPCTGRDRGAITDDAQGAVRCLTAEGLIRALVRSSERGICHPPSVIRHAYFRWLHTVNRPDPDWPINDGPGWWGFRLKGPPPVAR